MFKIVSPCHHFIPMLHNLGLEELPVVLKTSAASTRDPPSPGYPKDLVHECSQGRSQYCHHSVCNIKELQQ